MIELIEKISKKPRPAGSKELSKVRDVLVGKLKDLGFQVNLQKFPFTSWKLIEDPKIKINNEKVDVLPVVWSGSGVVKGTLKKANKIKTFEAYEWIRYKIVDSGKVKGYVITRPDQVWLQLIDNKSKLPYFMIYPYTYKKIKNKENVKVKASVKSKFLKNQKIQNILTKNNSDKKIIVCAHYDSMIGTVGANDNASGVSALMEVAKENKNNENLQFVLFSAEEFNKTGSYKYVNSLDKTGLKKIKLIINIDMVGHGEPYCICSKNLEAKIKNILPNNVNLSSKPRPPFDIWPFHKKKVNVVHFGSGPYDYCHDPKDTVDKIEKGPIKKTVKYVNKIISNFS